MVLRSERLPGEAEEILTEGERRVRLVFASSHSIPKVGDFSLFNEMFSEDEAEPIPECGELQILNEDEEVMFTGTPQEEQLVSDYEERDDEEETEITDPADEADNRLFRMLEQIFEERIPNQDEEADKYVLRCSGVMSVRDGDLVIRYNEDDSTGMGETRSEIVLHGGRRDMVSIVRTGGVVSTLICEKGRRHISAYRTPVMPFEVCVFARECEHSVEYGTGGSVYLNYYVEIRGTEMQHTRMRITIKPE